jgi:transposase-like protein
MSSPPLGEMSFREAYALSLNPQQVIIEMQQVGILASMMKCRKCSGNMNVVKRTDKGDGYCWRCPRKACKARISIREGSYFEGHRLSLGHLFMIIYCHFNFPKMLNTDIAKIVDCHLNTVTDWGRYIRESISHYYLENPIILGINGHAVQIDESLFGGKCKYHRGSHGRHRKGWVFGMIEEETGRNVMWMVTRRNRKTLLPIIRDHIQKGATIKSDEWGAYKTLKRHGFKHLQVNHSISFVTKDGIHTQLIESLWSQVKGILKPKRGTRNADLPGYLDNYSFISDAKFKNKTPLSFFFELIRVGRFY